MVSKAPTTNDLPELVMAMRLMQELSDQGTSHEVQPGPWQSCQDDTCVMAAHMLVGTQ